MKRYSGYKDSGVNWIGIIPESWACNRIKTICTFTYGNSLASEDRVQGEVPVYGSNGVVGYHNKALTRRPCIIIGRKGSFGKINVSETECFPIDTTYFVDERFARCELGWLSYVLPLLGLDKFSKDTGVPGLNREEAHDKKIPIPERETQKDIVAFLNLKTEQIDGLIAKKERMIELLKEERAALINQVVTKGLDSDVEFKESGIEWLGKIPKHWSVKRLKYVGKSIIGLTYSPDEVATEGTLVLRSSNVQNGEIDLDDTVYVKKQICHELFLQAGDILICSRNGSRALIGKCAYIDASYAGNTFGAFMTVFRSEANRFVFHVFNSVIFTFHIGSFLTATINQLTTGNLNGIIIPVPPPEEQLDIANFLDGKAAQIDEQIGREERLIELLKEHRTALISEVVTGKIDVRGYAA